VNINLSCSVFTLYHVNSLPKEQLCATKTLAAFMEVINQTVGDAISDLLIVETILHARGWNIQDWEAAYSDLPSKQLKVSVKVGISSNVLSCSCK
jgi:phosphoacetylglucosamine mutase